MNTNVGHQLELPRTNHFHEPAGGNVCFQWNIPSLPSWVTCMIEMQSNCSPHRKVLFKGFPLSVPKVLHCIKGSVLWSHRRVISGTLRRICCLSLFRIKTLQWRHNDHDGVSNHQPHGCLLNRLFRRRSKKTSKLRVTGLCVGNSPDRTKGQLRGKCFHSMTSSWILCALSRWLLIVLSNRAPNDNVYHIFALIQPIWSPLMNRKGCDEIVFKLEYK